jgi:hypothetical protein
MNDAFYRFWGQLLSDTTQYQKQMEALTHWMKQGFTGDDDLSKLFQRCYGLGTGPEKSAADSRAWEEAIASFRETFDQFVKQWGWVTQAEHQRVLDKCAQLEKTVDTQKETIRQLREVLAQKGLGYTELFEHAKRSFKQQSDQFQALMENFQKAGK